MKTIIIIIVTFFYVNVTAQTYLLDSQKSFANWTGYGEMGSFKQDGTIKLKLGQVVIEDGKILQGEIIFDAKSINHENKDLRKHLRAKDFFWTKKYPDIRFQITSVTDGEVKGKLTIRGITRDETFSYGKIEKDGLLIFSGEAKVDRTNYDIKYNSSSFFQDLGNYAIKNEFDLSFKLYFNEA